MFLTGFLTGFAKQAQASIAERNKEIRENIDETLKEKAEEVEKDRIVKKKLRADMKERSAMFTSAMDTDMEGLQLTVGQQLAIIGDEQTYNKFIEDIANYRGADSNVKQAIANRIKKNFGGKMNVDPSMSLDQAISASTQLDEIAMPTAITERTAFGIPSNIQQRAIERFKGRMPKELTGTRTKDPVVGKYQGLADVQDITQSESNKLVANFYENAISEVFVPLSGAKENSQLAGIRKNVRAEIKKLLNNKDLRDINGIIKPSQVASRIGSISKLDEGYADAIEELKKQTVNKVIKSYASKDGFIGPNLARALQSSLGLDIGSRVGRAKDKVFIGDQGSEPVNQESNVLKGLQDKEKKDNLKDKLNQVDSNKQKKGQTFSADPSKDTTSAQSQANNNLSNMMENYRSAKTAAERTNIVNNIKKSFNITGNTDKEVVAAAIKILKRGTDIPSKDKPSIANTAPGTTPAPKQRIINNLVQRHKFSASNRKKAIEKELAEKHNMTIEDARKYIEEEKKAGRI